MSEHPMRPPDGTTDRDAPLDPTPPLPPMPVAPPPARPTAHDPAQGAHGMAIASLVLGIVGIVLTITVWIGPICDVLAIVFGAIARGRIPRGAPDRGLATAGLVLGIVGLVLTAALLLLFVAAFSGEGRHIIVHGTSVHPLGG